jgi:site-specific recombinase XerD
VPKRSRPKVYSATEEDYCALLSAADTGTIEGLQTYVLVRLLWETGLRYSDLCKLTFSQLEQNGTIVVMHKTDTEVAVAWSEKTQEHVKRLKTLFRLVGQGHQYIFATKKINRPMTNQYACRKIKELAMQANVSDKISPHAFRRGSAKIIYQKYGPKAAQEFLGHSDMKTTSIYLEDKMEKQLENAINRFNIETNEKQPNWWEQSLNPAKSISRKKEESSQT